MKTKATTMKTKARITLFGLVMVIALCYANFANAESDFATGAGASASARLDFQIVIPTYVYFRVGTAGAGNIDTISFNPTGAEIGTSGAITAGTGGDATGGAVNVVLVSNNGDVTITPTNNGGLTSGGNTISYTQITTGDTGSISAPILTDAGGTAEVITSGAFGITNLTDTWTYEYINPATPPAVGTYTDQVTYTAVIP